MVKLSGNLAERKALVVGGSGGVGALVSRALAEAGANMVVHGGHRKKALEQVAEDCRAHGVLCETVLQELKHPDDVLSLVAKGIPDVLVVAFGPVRWKGVSEEGVKGWNDMTLSNLAIPGALVSACVSELKRRGFGRIVLFGASRGEICPPSMEATAYTAAKSGLVSLVRSVAKDASGSNVTCNLFCPGYVDTEYLSDAQRARFARRSPSGRLTDPKDIANAVVYLCGTAGHVINGAVINVGEGLV